jgi:hypothetical protein
MRFINIRCIPPKELSAYAEKDNYEGDFNRCLLKAVNGYDCT